MLKNFKKYITRYKKSVRDSQS